jgi:hypothetical protein
MTIADRQIQEEALPATSARVEIRVSRFLGVDLPEAPAQR